MARWSPTTLIAWARAAAAFAEFAAVCWQPIGTGSHCEFCVHDCQSDGNRARASSTRWKRPKSEDLADLASACSRTDGWLVAGPAKSHRWPTAKETEQVEGGSASMVAEEPGEPLIA